MYRLINPAVAGLQGKSVYSTPRRYVHLKTAIRRAVQQTKIDLGVREIQNDERLLVAIVRKGHLLTIDPIQSELTKFFRL